MVKFPLQVALLLLLFYSLFYSLLNKPTTLLPLCTIYVEP